MVRKLLLLALIGSLSCLSASSRAQTGRLSISDIEILLRDALSDPRQRPLLRILRATVCQSPAVKREISVDLLIGLDCGSDGPPGRQSALRGGPSFDCRKARTAVELMICRDPGLAALDVILADAYDGVISLLPPGERQALRREEDRWIAGRDRCVSASDTYTCVTRAYSRRIQELNAY